MSTLKKADAFTDMEYPGDVAVAFERLGFTVAETGLKPNLIRLKATVRGKRPINILLVRGEEFCYSLMRGVKFSSDEARKLKRRVTRTLVIDFMLNGKITSVRSKN